MADLELNSIGNGDGNNYLLRDNSKIPLSGSNQISGDLVPATDNSYNLGSATNNYNTVYTRNINHGLSSSSLILSGGNGASNGSNLVLYGIDRSDGFQGIWQLTARGTNSYYLRGNTDGSITTSATLIRPTTDSGCNLGSSNYGYGSIYTTAIFARQIRVQPSNLNDSLSIGTIGQTGSIYLNHNDMDASLAPVAYRGSVNLITGNGAIRLDLYENGELTWSGNVIRPTTDGGTTLGTGSLRFGQIYSTNSAISTSDERQKDNIKQIDDKLLQAWGNVNIVQFNFKDALEKKGENARLHTGYIAQNIQQACEENGINPNDYGLFCHDSWEEQEEKKDENGQVIEPYRAKGDLYSLRYEEALVVEGAYLRRENAKLKEQLQRHEDYLKLVEEHLHLINL